MEWKILHLIPCAQLASLELGYQGLIHLTSFLCASLPLNSAFLQYLSGKGAESEVCFVLKVVWMVAD